MPKVMGSVGSEKNSNDLPFKLSVSHTFLASVSLIQEKWEKVCLNSHSVAIYCK